MELIACVMNACPMLHFPTPAMVLPFLRKWRATYSDDTKHWGLSVAWLLTSTGTCSLGLSFSQPRPLRPPIRYVTERTLSHGLASSRSLNSTCREQLKMQLPGARSKLNKLAWKWDCRSTFTIIPSVGRLDWTPLMQSENESRLLNADSERGTGNTWSCKLCTKAYVTAERPQRMKFWMHVLMLELRWHMRATQTFRESMIHFVKTWYTRRMQRIHKQDAHNTWERCREYISRMHTIYKKHDAHYTWRMHTVHFERMYPLTLAVWIVHSATIWWHIQWVWTDAS